MGAMGPADSGLGIIAFDSGRFVAVFQRDNQTGTWRARAEDGTMVPVDTRAALDAIGSPERFVNKSAAEMMAIAAQVARKGIA